MPPQLKYYLKSIFLMSMLLALLGLSYSHSLAQNTDTRTLILTNKAALIAQYGNAATTGLLAQVDQFAAHPAVKGVVILVEETPEVAAAYAAWQANLTSPAHANAVADAIRSLLFAQEPLLPNLDYIVLVGDDRVIPYRRVVDETTTINEQRYEQVSIDTTVGSALAANMFLSDDFYGEEESLFSANQHEATAATQLFRPSLAVGRLVETPLEMGAALAKFLQTNGQIQISGTLVVGYDFVADAAQQICDIFSPIVAQTPDCSLIGENWKGATLAGKLQDENASLIFLHTHADHEKIGAPDSKQILATTATNWSAPTGGRLVYSVGTHNGLNVPPQTAQSVDWAQTWVAQGSVYIANTGYSWGQFNATGFSETLGILLAENLAVPAAITVGQALLAAKGTYINSKGTLDAYDKKVVNELMLYGLPMTKVVGFAVTPDEYEPDNSCEQASSTTTDGVVQIRNFHQADDVDWVSFDAVLGQTYFIEAKTALSSTTELVTQLYVSCPVGPLTTTASTTKYGGSFIEFSPPTSGRYLLKFTDGAVDTFASDSAYQLTIRQQITSDQVGAIIVVAGRTLFNDALQSNIHNVTNAVYNQFRAHGYTDDRIYYLATDASLPGYDAEATVDNLRNAITSWAVDKVSAERQLTLYLVDSGDRDTFYLDKIHGQQFTPDHLNSWLDTLEIAVPGLNINIIIDQCYAGSFIDAPTSVSKPGRLIIASSGTNDLAWATRDGALFSDAFVNALMAGSSLYDALQAARSVTENHSLPQLPQVDGDGDAIPDEAEDDAEAQRRTLFPMSGTATPTATPTVTTPSPTPTVTPPLTPSATPVATTTADPNADAYEVDNACPQAHTILTDGSVQIHNFHQAADVDWLKIAVTADTTYQVDITVPDNSTADVTLASHTTCNASGESHNALGPGVRIRFRAEVSGEYYLQLTNAGALFGQQASYEMAVRALPVGPQAGALVIVAGRNSINDSLQPNIHQSTDDFYKLFLRHGYTSDRIYYMAHDNALDPDGNPQTVDVDGLSTRAQLEYAITEWAAHPQFGLGPEHPFMLYLMDHGNYGKFYLNGTTEMVTPEELDQWLQILEQRVPGLAVNIIIDACLSGSFIDTGSPLSRPGRVIITSTANRSNAYIAEERGTLFTNAFVQALDRGFSLYHAFQAARMAAVTVRFDQTAWLDDNGNGLANDAADGLVAQTRGFAFAGTLGIWDEESPYIMQVEPPTTIVNGTGTISAHVRSQNSIVEVQAMLVSPTYTPPSATGDLLPAIDQPTIALSDPDDDGIYTGSYAGFINPGTYRIIVSAIDDLGNFAQPVTITARTEDSDQLFLPLIFR